MGYLRQEGPGGVPLPPPEHLRLTLRPDGTVEAYRNDSANWEDRARAEYEAAWRAMYEDNGSAGGDRLDSAEQNPYVIPRVMGSDPILDAEFEGENDWYDEDSEFDDDEWAEDFRSQYR